MNDNRLNNKVVMRTYTHNTHNYLVRKGALKHLAKLVVSFKCDFIVDTPYLGKSFLDLLSKVFAL